MLPLVVDRRDASVLLSLLLSARGPRTSGPLTLPRPSRAVRCRPSAQVNGLCLFAGVAVERCESERLAVNLAVSAWPRLALDSLDLPRGGREATLGAVDKVPANRMIHVIGSICLACNAGASWTFL